jgi:Flp pilus assembly protein protease CpaA
MQIFVIRVISLIVIGLIYMIFDLFNKRNIPSWFVYSALAYGIFLTLLYLNLSSILISAAIALVIFLAGYLVYLNGSLGAGDVFEFTTLSLILPFQAFPLLSTIGQLGLPFIISIFMATGIAALVIVPIYYLPKSRIRHIRIGKEIPKGDLGKAILVSAIYLLFAIFLIVDIGVSIEGMAVLILLILGSAMIMLFQKPIAEFMIEYVDVNKFEAGDMIAINLMSPYSIANAKKRVKSFGKLVTPKLIAELKRKRIKNKFPVYKRAVPLAAPIFIGIITSLLFGNLILLLVVH